MSSVEHVLRVNGWMLAYRLVLGERMLDWRGPREARVVQRDDTTGASSDEPGVSPDAEALIDLGAESPPLGFLVELARDASPSDSAATTPF
jgi:hypothetical protein